MLAKIVSIMQDYTTKKNYHYYMEKVERIRGAVKARAI